MSTEKTHYRKAFNSPCLAAVDLVGPIQVTIDRVKLEPNPTKQSKDLFNVVYFSEREIRPGEKLKPMMLNATNSKMLTKITGSPFIEDWAGTRITIKPVSGIRFGRDTVDGLRIFEAEQESPPTDEQLALIQECRERGAITPEQEMFISSGKLTEKLAARLIAALSKAA